MSLPVASLTRIGTTTELGVWGMEERGREAESIYSQILLGSLQLYKAPSQLALPSLPRTKNATVSAHSTNPREGTMIISRSEVSGIFLCWDTGKTIGPLGTPSLLSFPSQPYFPMTSSFTAPNYLLPNVSEDQNKANFTNQKTIFFFISEILKHFIQTLTFS